LNLRSFRRVGRAAGFGGGALSCLSEAGSRKEDQGTYEYRYDSLHFVSPVGSLLLQTIITAKDAKKIAQRARSPGAA
jgi:hypothetical protein